MPLRITNWNVNGIRNPFSYQPWSENRTYQAMFDTLEADIVIMQETKIQRKDLKDDMVLVPGWDVYFSLPRHKKGYSGVAIYVRTSKCCPIRAEEGLTGVLTAPNSIRFRDLPPEQQIGGYPEPGQLTSAIDDLTLDSEGRCVVLEFPAFVLMGIYSPAKTTPPKTGSSRAATSQDDDELDIELTRSDFRYAFMELLDVRIRNLIASGKQVVVTGDLNVSRAAKDSAGIIEALSKIDATVDDWLEEPTRRIFNQLVFDGEVVGDRDPGRENPVVWDLCRDFYPKRESMYTCWDVRRNLRPANFGSRIDYVLCSPGLRSWFVDANIQEGLMGSDHCPVYGVLSDKIVIEDEAVDLVDLMNPAGMVSNGARRREWVPKDALPLSARLIPEFDRRRSIRDMFMKASSPAKPKPVNQTPTIASLPVSLPPKRPRAESPDSTPESTPSYQDQSSQPNNPNPPTPSRTQAAQKTSRPLKKAKSAVDSKKKPDPSQATIKGFFQSKSQPSPTPTESASQPPPSTTQDKDSTPSKASKEPRRRPRL